jgi:hypothetical protein
MNVTIGRLIDYIDNQNWSMLKQGVGLPRFKLTLGRICSLIIQQQAMPEV